MYAPQSHRRNGRDDAPTDAHVLHDDGTNFRRTAPPRTLDADALDSMSAPDAVGVERGTPAFAVAAARGVAFNVETRREAGAIAVLYLTADRERVIERWFPTSATPPRACIAPDGRLSEAGEAARGHAAALDYHDEATDDEGGAER